MAVAWRNIGSDTFNRADNGLGSLDGGEKSGTAWSALAGTWKINLNRAGATTAGHSAAVVDFGEADGEAYVTLSTAGDDGGLIARATDDDNYLLLAFNATADTVKLYKREGGALTPLTGDLAVAGGVDDGAVIKLVLRGDSVTIVVDDVTIGSVTQAFNQTATKHGLRENSAAAKSFYDNFGFRERERRQPSLYVAQNVGVQALAPKGAPSCYVAQNVGAAAKALQQPVLHAVQNAGDHWPSKLSDQRGPEFAFPPRIDDIVPTFGREGSVVRLDGLGLGDECVLLRFGQDDAFDAQGDYAAGTGYARGSVPATANTWTLELWFRGQQSGRYGTAARESGGSLAELCAYNAGSPIVRYTLELASGRVRARCGAASVTTPGWYDNGRMHHARVVYAAGSMTLLVDGVVVGSQACANYSVDWVRLAGTQAYARADMREARLCQANLGTGPFDPDDVWDYAPHGSDVGLWHCDDGSGATVADSSGYGSDLALQGDDWLWTDLDFGLEVWLGAAKCGGPTEVRNLGCLFTIPVGAATGQVKVKHTQVHPDESNTKPFTVLPEVPLRGTGYEVRIYDRDNYGTLLAILENAFGVGGQHELDQAGAGQFSIHASDPKATAAIVRHGNLCRIYWEGLERYAFVIEQVSETLLAEGDESSQVVSCAGRGVLSLLEHAIVYPPNWPTQDPLKTTYTEKTAGHIIGDQVDKAIARGALVNFSCDFDDDVDSLGVEWPETFDLDLEPGVTLWSVAQQFVTLGYDAHLDSNLVLHLYVARGLDRTAGGAPVVFRQGHNLYAKQRDSSSAEVKTHALVAGAETLSEFAKASGFPRRETFMDARNTDSVGTAQKAAAMTLATLCIEDEGFTSEVESIVGCSEVFEDFDVGDWVLVDVPGKVDLATYRVRGITMSVGDDDRPHWVVDFNSIRHEWGVRLKRMLDALTGGSLRGSTGSGRTEGISPTTMVDAAGGKGTFECTVKITVDSEEALLVQDTSLNKVFVVDTLDRQVELSRLLILDGDATPVGNVLLSVADNVLEIDGPVRVDPSAAGAVIEGRGGGEDQPKASLLADRIAFGPGGSTSPDVEWVREAPNVWATGDALLVRVDSADAFSFRTAGDALRARISTVDEEMQLYSQYMKRLLVGLRDGEPQPRVELHSDRLKFGPGDAALDVELYRSGADELTIPDTLVLGAALKVDTVVEAVPNAGVMIEGVCALDSFLELGEIAKPATPAANKARLYAKDRGGVSWPYALSDDGAEAAWGADVGTREEFLLPMIASLGTPGLVDDWYVVSISVGVPNNGECYFTWRVPPNFKSLNSANVILIPDATETVQADLDVSVAAVGEDYNADTRQLLNQTKDVTINDITEWDIKLGTLLDGIAAGDYVAIRFQSNTATLQVVGCRISYEVG